MYSKDRPVNKWTFVYTVKFSPSINVLDLCLLATLQHNALQLDIFLLALPNRNTYSLHISKVGAVSTVTRKVAKAHRCPSRRKHAPKCSLCWRSDANARLEVEP